MVGESFSRVMKIFPVRHNSGSSSHTTSEDHHLDYYAIAHSSLTGLYFQLRGLDGEMIEFEEEHHPTVYLMLLMKEN